MSDLPLTWAHASLDDLADNSPASLTDGPFGSNLKTSHYTERGPRVIRLQNIGDGNFVDERAHISEEHFARLARHEAKAGDVVVAMLGESLPRACVVPGHVGPAIVKADCARLRVDKSIATPSFVAHALNSVQLRSQAEALVHGVGRPRLGLKWLRELRVPLAPEREQHRIVEAIESYFTRVDDAVATLERVQRNLKRYRASVLKAAVEGRLVPTEAELARAERREYESASVSLERMSQGRSRLAWHSRPEEVVASDRAELPEGWSRATVEQITTRITSGSRDWTPYYNRGDGVFLMAQNVRPGKLDLSFRQAVDPPPDDPSCRRSQVAAGDVLVTIVGANAGNVCRVPLELPRHFVCQSVALMRPAGPVLSEYLDFYLNSPPGQQQFASFMYGQGRPHLSFDDLRRTLVPLPPLAEQVRIVRALGECLSLVDSTLATVIADASRVTRLRQSILKWAFEGRLVDQDPTDEPASVLLERIKAERAAARPESRPTTRKSRRSKA